MTPEQELRIKEIALDAAREVLVERDMTMVETIKRLMRDDYRRNGVGVRTFN